MPLPDDARLFAVIPAAGVGARTGAPLPKQYLTVRGHTVAEHTLRRLLSVEKIQSLVVATAGADLWWPQLSVSHHGRIRSVLGGVTRADSVLECLNALSGTAKDTDWVLVHDMARPCVCRTDIVKLIDACGDQGAILAAPVVDTIKRANGEQIKETVSREHLWRALTPQLFPVGPLRDALAAGIAKGDCITDEASAMEMAGWKPKLVEGRSDNIKLTLASDLALVGFYLSQQEKTGEA